MAWQRRATPAGRSWWVLGMSERRTDAIESGSSPDDWVTPTAAIATGGQTSRSGARKGELLLAGQAQASWPTAKASDGRAKGTGGTKDRGLDAMARAGLMQESARPTPASRDWRDDGEAPSAQARKSPCLPAAVTLASARPTPASCTYGSNQGGAAGRVGPKRHSLESHPALWPTATATDAKASGAAGYSTASGRHSGTTLTDATCGPRGRGSSSTNGKSRARLNATWVEQLLGFPAGWTSLEE